MKYRIDLYLDGKCRQGKQLLDTVDEAITLAKKVATHYHGYTCIARVQA